MRQGPSANSDSLTQQAYLIDEAVSLPGEDISYNDYSAGGPYVLLDSLGSITLPASSSLDLYYDTDSASAGDLALLDARLSGNGGPGWVGFLFEATAGREDWGDHESGFAPQLVLNVVPEPSSIWLLLAGSLAAAFWLRRKSVRRPLASA